MTTPFQPSSNAGSPFAGAGSGMAGIGNKPTAPSPAAYTQDQAKAAAQQAIAGQNVVAQANVTPTGGLPAQGFIATPQKPATPPPTAEDLSTVSHGSRHPQRLGDILVAKGLINEDQLKKALSQAKASKRPLGLVLVRMGLLDDETLGRALADLHHLEYLSLKNIKVPPEVLKSLPEEFMKRHLVLPIHIHHELRRIEVAMARPDVVSVLDEVALLTGYRAVPKVSTHRELIAFFDGHFKTAYSGEEALKKLEEDFASEDSLYASQAEDLASSADVDDAPVVMLVNAILMEAIETGASDIHVEPQQAQLLIRYRIDGILKEIKSIPRKMAGSVISRIKVTAGMDIAERRRPQDGRMRVKSGSQEVDMRVSSIPLQFGEKICIRILRSNVMTGGISQLGLTEDEEATITRMIKAPNGIILVTGPTGSGKTTTLYACLREINSPDINISTAEDPIEYPLSGINQVPINAKAGVTFAGTLRALLRQDPDVILVGEIRDEETLESAIHAAMTGHLVFSTLHTNSAAKTVTRLLDMGAPSYLVSSSVVGILAQRLVRKVCPQCKTQHEATAEERDVMGWPADQPLTLVHGAGCQHCDNSGYKGRTPIYEFLRVTREIQELVDKNAPTFAIQDMAVKQGMSTLGASGRRKVLEGHTTVEEIVRVLGLDLDT